MSGYSGTKLKRSTSLSHIPLPTSIRESRSSFRGKTRCEAPPRTRSSDQKLLRSNSYSNLRMTPLQSKHSVGRPSSIRKLPSSASRSPFMKRDRPVNDKKWVAEQFVKVRRYLEDHPDCDPTVVDKLKPPTLNTFVYVCNILLKGLDHRININMSNYKQVVISQLKALCYPGSVSNSLLITVNTMHAWPQVVGMFSWIIDLLTYLATNTVNQDTLDIGSELNEVHQNYFGEAYLLFNTNNNQTMAGDKFAIQIMAIYGVNNEEQKEYVNEVENLRKVDDERILQLNKNTDEINALKAENEEMNKVIHKFNFEDPTLEKEKPNNLEMLVQKKQKIIHRRVDVKNDINQLKETISNQHCTYAEKESIYSQIQEMKYTLKLKTEKQQECRNIQSDFDFQFVDWKKKIETEVSRLNSARVQISLKNPEIKSLQLRDRGFHDENFKNEIDEFIQTKLNLEDKVTQDIAEIRTCVITTEDKSKTLCDNRNNLKETVKDLNLKQEELKKQVKVADGAAKLVVDNTEQLRKQHLLSLNDIKCKEPNLDDLEMQISKFIEEKSQLEEEFKLIQMDSLQFFEKLHNASICNLKKFDQLRTRIFEKVNEEATIKNHVNISTQFDLLDECVRNISPHCKESE